MSSAGRNRLPILSARKEVAMLLADSYSENVLNGLNRLNELNLSLNTEFLIHRPLQGEIEDPIGRHAFAEF